MQGQVARAAVSPQLASGWPLLRWFSMLLMGMAVLLCLGGTRAYSMGQAPAAPAQASPEKAAPSSARPAMPVAQETKAKEADDHGLNTGIKVHGHWVIKVYNPDGKLVSHSEFENKLQPAGQLEIAALLSGYVPGDWEIQLDAAQPQQKPICTNSDYTSGVGPCDIVETGGYFQTTACPGRGDQCFPTLQVVNPVQTVPPFTQSNTVNLQGTATSATAGEITDVQTEMEVCYPTVTPSVCQTGNGILTSGVFTAVSLPTSNTTATPCGGTGQISCAVPVAAGQTVNVSVTISFQ